MAPRWRTSHTDAVTTDATGTTIPALPGVGPAWPLEGDDDRTIVRPLQFVEVQPSRSEASSATIEPVPITPPPSESRWSLWGELEA